MTIKAIAEKLSEMSEALEAGRLNIEEINEMHNLASQIHERMVILRFKAFEEGREEPLSPYELHGRGKNDAPAAAEDDQSPVPAPKPEKSAPAPEPEEAPEAADPVPPEAAEPETQAPEPETPEPPRAEEPEERPAFRIGKPAAPEVSPNQISLIDSIEEIKRMEKSINDQFKESGNTTLARKLKQTPIKDLKAAISINMRFQFVSVLFKNDNETYNNAIEKLNNFSGFIEADEYLRNSLMDRFEWEKKNPAVKQLFHLVERRYL